MAFTRAQIERYSRHILLPEIGVRGQKTLLESKVLIIGAGGLGSPAALYLAAAGVGTIGIVDHDTVDLSNLQRQILHGTGDVGTLKVTSAQETMARLNPDITIKTYPIKVNSKNILELLTGYDFVLDATDHFDTKFLINDACVLAKKPFCHAGVIRWTGQLMTYVPGQGPCYRCVFQNPPPPDAVPSCSQAGVMGAVVGIIGTLQAIETVKYFLGMDGLLVGFLLTYDAKQMEFRKIPLPHDTHRCAVCGDHPTIVTLTDENKSTCGDRA